MSSNGGSATEAMATIGGVITDLKQIAETPPVQPGLAERTAQILDRLAIEITEAAAMLRAAESPSAR